MGETYACEGADCNPDTVITQMVEERGTFSTQISQQIQQTSNILRLAEPIKAQFPSGSGDFVKSSVLDIATPSTRDVIDHQKRLASAKPTNSPCDIPVKTIPYGSHTIEACLFGWAWDTQWFCKTDLAFKYKREEQIGQIKAIMTAWASGIWDKWVWRAYQRSVQNYVLNVNIPDQHGSVGYKLENPTSILTIPFLDYITVRLRDASGMVGTPTKGAWCILIGEEECKVLFDHYFKAGADEFGLRKMGKMEDYKRYDQSLLGGMEYYELSNYKFFVECRAPRYRDRVGNETWDDALLDDMSQVSATNGTESQVPAGYRDPDVAKYSEILIFNQDACKWLTPPIGMTENNNFHKDAHPGYSYAGEFIPVPEVKKLDPLGKKIKYYAEFVAGMQSTFPKKGASILALAAHVNPELETINYNLTPTTTTAETVAVQANTPILPVGTLQIQTRNPLPNVADGYRLFLVTAGGAKAKIATFTSDYCEDMGYWLHSLTFENADAGACVPRDCDQWKEVKALAEGTADDVLVDEDGCAICSGYNTTATSDPMTVTYVGDNIASVTLGSTVIEGTVAATLESDVQTHLDSNGGGTVTITEGTSPNYVWEIEIDGNDGTYTSFSVQAQLDGGGVGSFSSTPTATEPTSSQTTVFSVVDNETDGGFVTYKGDYYDSGENVTTGGYPIWTNGTTYAANDNADWDGAAMNYFASLAHAQAGTPVVYESAASGVANIDAEGASTAVVGIQS